MYTLAKHKKVCKDMVELMKKHKAYEVKIKFFTGDAFQISTNKAGKEIKILKLPPQI